MSILTFLISLFLFILFFSFSIFLWFMRKQIAMFISPEKYAEVNMVELDDNIFHDIVKKNEDLTWEFNGNDYFLYYPERISQQEILDISTKDKEVIRVKSTVFRSGRIASFTYIEGQQEPIDFRDMKKSFSQDSKIKKEFAKVQLSKLVSSVSDFNEFLDKYKIWIALGVVIIIVILLFRQPKVVIDPTLLAALPQKP